MEFRLTYTGPLYATQRDPVPGQAPRHTQNRHDLRVAFHHQLKALWQIAPLTQDSGAPALITTEAQKGFVEPVTRADDLAKKHAHYGFNFVPLVTQELDLLCGLDILFLRPDRPGDVIWAGDIDNRIKTLLDALRIPEAGELYVNRTPADDEKPFFCLLEDDKLITKVSVETDRLLVPTTDKTTAHLVITVKVRPYDLSLYNIHLG
jgi:hypothetical protein